MGRGELGPPSFRAQSCHEPFFQGPVGLNGLSSNPKFWPIGVRLQTPIVNATNLRTSGVNVIIGV
jgi:hypothetical protein